MRAAAAEITAITATGAQPPPVANPPTSRPSTPNAVAVTVRRTRSRTGPGRGAMVATKDPMVAKTPALRAGPGSIPPSTATATARGAGGGAGERAAARPGAGGRLG